ncbi:unnamed protein product [Schistosoma curassoni]|uniref:Uncharacterized protein n=1 Tax=Schistosoma curassoni TaxID=6186 RepID=A0A183KLF6_9TREM|nr:unnamed protein product [Schistosoma curassoni]
MLSRSLDKTDCTGRVVKFNFKSLPLVFLIEMNLLDSCN